MLYQMAELEGRKKSSKERSFMSINMGKQNIKTVREYSKAAGFISIAELVRAALHEYMVNHPVEERQDA